MSKKMSLLDHIYTNDLTNVLLRLDRCCIIW